VGREKQGRRAGDDLELKLVLAGGHRIGRRSKMPMPADASDHWCHEDPYGALVGDGQQEAALKMVD
jgi:hypothetical protein